MLIDGITNTGTISGLPYDIAGSTVSQPTNSVVVMRHSVNRAFTIPENFVGSKAESTVAPTAQTIYSVQKNGVQFGTITFAAGVNDGVFYSAADTSFVVGDLLTIVAPGTADATHDELAWTLAAVL